MQAQAQLKLLKEMESNESSAVDKIHVWLNQNMDDEIANGIVKDKKTIDACYQFVMNKARNLARKQKKSGGIAIDSETVFEWVRDFYTNKKIKTKQNKEKQIITPKPGKKTKEKVDKDAEQLSLFDI